MFRVIATTTRTDITVPFFKESEEYKTWFDEKYITTGICERSMSTSEDMLTLTVVSDWRSENDHEDYKNEAKARYMFIDRNHYNHEHGMLRTIKTQEI